MFRRLAEHGTQRSSAALPDGAERHRIQRMLQTAGGVGPCVQRGPATGRGAVDAGKGYASFHGGNDVRQADVFGVAGQYMPAGYAPDAFDNAAALQQSHDLLDEFFRDARTDSQF